MKVLLTTVGSDGDVQPFLALSKGLIAAGHDVRFAAVERYAARGAALGIPFLQIGAGWDDQVMSERFAAVLREKNPLRQLTMIMSAIKDELVAMVPELTAAARGVDVVICPPMQIAAVAAARAARVPYIAGHLISLIRSRNINPRGSNLGPIGNALVWHIVHWITRRATDDLLNEVVRAAGLEPWRDVLLQASHSRLQNLLAVSPLVIPPDPLWPAHYRATGYWFLEEPSFTPDPALAAFVEREPPIVITFGSMAGIDARATTQKLLGAVRGLERRVVLQSGWAGLGEGDLPDNVMRAAFVPHGWLFARAACVVHHGGVGTTAAALRAGVPQVVVWHLGDQPAWGTIVERLGVGPKTRSHQQLDARWLRKALERMLGDQAMIERARALGARIREEDGVGNAVRWIEECLASGRGHPGFDPG